MGANPRKERSSMTVAKLPSGRWRARVWHDGKDQAAGKILGTGETSYATKRDAKRAEADARAMIRPDLEDVTVRAFWERWTTDPLFARPKASTGIHNRERTKAFAERYGSLAMRHVGDRVVAEWLAGGKRNGTVPALRAMFNDAASAKGGRLVDRNPFAGLGIARTRGNRDVQPPAQDVVWDLVRAARRLSGPSFAAWLQVAAFTGMRPGELDALRWDALDFDTARILVAEQFSAATGTFTLPKNGKRRWAPMTGPAREILTAVPRESEFCFVNLRGHHWTAPARAYHWKATRSAVGYDGTLYVATRHHAGWYMRNVLGLNSEDVAIALGHTDGGELVRRLYGHLDHERALDRVVGAYDERSNVRPLSPRPRHVESA
jgi:integrase